MTSSDTLLSPFTALVQQQLNLYGTEGASVTLHPLINSRRIDLIRRIMFTSSPGQQQQVCNDDDDDDCTAPRIWCVCTGGNAEWEWILSENPECPLLSLSHRRNCWEYLSFLFLSQPLSYLAFYQVTFCRCREFVLLTTERWQCSIGSDSALFRCHCRHTFSQLGSLLIIFWSRFVFSFSFILKLFLKMHFLVLCFYSVCQRHKLDAFAASFSHHSPRIIVSFELPLVYPR